MLSKLKVQVESNSLEVESSLSEWTEMCTETKPLHSLHTQLRDIIRKFEGFVASIQYLKEFA